MAAAYAFHLCKNHPFIDGNKRTALASMVVFLRLNGWVLTEDQTQAEALILRIAKNETDKAGIEDWLGDHCRARPSMELRDFFQSINEQKLMKYIESTMNASPNEQKASLFEASREFPLVRAFVDTIEFWHSQGKDDRCEKYGHNVILLMAFYRLAEDMGYEW